MGADIGGTKMAVGVVDEAGSVLHRSSETSVGRELDDLLDALEGEIRAALDAHPEADAVGVGFPCRFDRERGYAVGAVNLPIADAPVRDLLEERLGRSVSIDNDGNLAALAEHRHGAARDAGDVVLLTIGTGIGGGLVLEGRPYRGARGGGAELGHVVIDQDGPPCQGSCPNRGCVEVLASGTALGVEGRRLAEQHPHSRLGRALVAGEAVDGVFVTREALAGDPVALEAVATIGTRLGVALSTLANIFEPDVIVVGGGAGAALGELLLAPAREELRVRALAPMNATPVVGAELGPDSGMIGAATLAMDESGTAG